MSKFSLGLIKPDIMGQIEQILLEFIMFGCQLILTRFDAYLLANIRMVSQGTLSL